MREILRSLRVELALKLSVTIIEKEALKILDVPNGRGSHTAFIAEDYLELWIGHPPNMQDLVGRWHVDDPALVPRFFAALGLSWP